MSENVKEKEIENLKHAVESLNRLISDLSNTDDDCGSAYCFALRLEYEERIVLLRIKIEELETELQQYKAYVSDITTAIQKNICKDFCPNIEPASNWKKV